MERPFRWLIGGKSEEREVPDMHGGGAVEGGIIENEETRNCCLCR